MFILVGPFVIGHLIITSAYNAPEELYGETGCYFATFLTSFSVVFFQFRSFFNALFRYLCIVHNGQLTGIGSKVSQLFVYMAQVC